MMREIISYFTQFQPAMCVYALSRGDDKLCVDLPTVNNVFVQFVHRVFFFFISIPIVEALC